MSEISWLTVISEEEELVDVDNENDFQETDERGNPFRNRQRHPNYDPSLSIYLRQISEYPLLYPEQETDLFQRLSACRYALAYCQNSDDMPDKTEEIRQWEQRLWNVKTIIIQANLSLVVSASKKYYRAVNAAVSPSDLMQEGNEGLIKAIDRFDWRRGYKFSTYAMAWIRQAMGRAIERYPQTIRQPSHATERERKIYRAQQRLIEDGQTPTIETLAKETNLRPRQIENINRVQCLKNLPSLDYLVDKEKNDKSFMDTIPVSDESPEQMAREKEVAERLETVLRKLPKREAATIRLRFGLIDGHKHTLEQIGRMFGITRERVRQIEARALGKLQSPAYKKLLEELLDEC